MLLHSQPNPNRRISGVRIPNAVRGVVPLLDVDVDVGMRGEFPAFVVFSFRWAYLFRLASPFRLVFAPRPPFPVLLPIISASVPDCRPMTSLTPPPSPPPPP